MILRGPRMASRRLARFVADLCLMTFWFEVLLALAFVVALFFFL